ncbi:hypothetical protein MUU46_04340 [Scandinavium sp. TWS1a]|uniref:hypothetical protein n=1 Tax=Scandinavium tedordense TaxID=2926521 RepID=UPI00216504E3|nr:hypothetical protein [Scandinavium tedordense]MCS2169554.1 hypothetical protein [Scandinavium tedordense]
MPTFTAEAALDILSDWLQDNIDCGTHIIFDNDEERTDPAVLLPLIRQVRRDVADLRHLQLLRRPESP